MSKKSFAPIDYSSFSPPSQPLEALALTIPKLQYQTPVNPEPDYSALELIAIILRDLNEVQLPAPQPLKRTQSSRIPV